MRLTFSSQPFLLLAAIAALILSGCASREERIQKVQTKANQALFEDDSAKAIKTLRSGLDRFPDSNEIRVDLARAVQNAGELEEAADLLESAIAQDPEADQLWVKIGELRSRLGQSDEAIRAFESYLKNHADDFLAWKAVAQENEKRGKLTDAIKAAAKWNELTPSSQPALKLGELYLASRNIAQARSWFGQSAAYADNFAAKDALAELIKLETSLKQFQQAQVWLAQYERRYPDSLQDPRIQDSKTVLDNWEKARREIAAAAAALELERETLENDRLEAERAAAEEQSQALAQALQNDPTAEAENGAAESNDSGEASSSERPALALFEESKSAGEGQASEQAAPPSAATGGALDLRPFDQAMAHLNEGEYDQAIPLFWNLLGENANNAEAWYRLSQAYYAQQNWYDAEATILEAKRRAPRSEAIANQYLLTLRNTQTVNQVLEEGKALRLLFPRNPAIALTLAQTLRAADAPRSIVSAAYRDFLSIARRGDPGFAEANQYLQNGN